jgi:tetratricopeptide (TPR) repeat protein
MDNAESLWRQAEQCRAAGQWKAADRFFSEAIATHPTSAVLIAYGAFLAERQNHPAALRHLMTGLDLAKRTGRLDLQGVAYSHLAVVYRELGDHDLARRFQRLALTLDESADAEDLLAWCQDALLADRAPLAEKLARSALDVAEAGNDVGPQADAWGLLGVVAARQGKLRLAVRLLIRAIRGHALLDDDHGLGTDFQNLAEVCGLLERFLWQRRFLAAAEICFERHGMPLSADRAQRRLRDVNRLLSCRTVDVRRN